MATGQSDLNTAISVLRVLLCTFGFTGNALVCITIGNTKSLHNVTNLMILNLAVADALACFCAIHQPWIIDLYTLYPPQNATECSPELFFQHDSIFVYYYVKNCFYTHSVLGLMLATVERFVGIVRPLHHRSFFSRRKIVLLLVAMWVVPFVVELPQILFVIIHFRKSCPYTEPESGLLLCASSVLLLAIPAGAIFLMYARILCNLKRGTRTLVAQGIPQPAQQLLHAYKKVSGTLSDITAAFFLFIFPCRIWRIVLSTGTGDINDSIVLLSAVELLTMLNSVINPVVYGFKYDQLRQAFKAIVCPCDNNKKPLPWTMRKLVRM
ncbi:5-hydroxytryptamine receptor 2A-like [Acanthaster planci]|uniref:5-hydroxytryptamine receptor 2A-like n=1 Tax=Acanthaster planci TaxID=133434 RepID=A0A8B7YFL8_ACAPL|nr:5-hydroxytryptamine receptor 2A-like [Acanthaster planci]